MTRRCGFGVAARLALLALMAQAIIPTVHHIWHGYPPIVARIAALTDTVGAATSGDHEHHRGTDRPPPAADTKTPICPICQTAQHFAAALPPADGPLQTPFMQQGGATLPPEQIVHARPSFSPAQPRAPPSAA